MPRCRTSENMVPGLIEQAERRAQSAEQDGVVCRKLLSDTRLLSPDVS